MTVMFRGDPDCLAQHDFEHPGGQYALTGREQELDFIKQPQIERLHAHNMPIVADSTQRTRFIVCLHLRETALPIAPVRWILVLENSPLRTQSRRPK